MNPNLTTFAGTYNPAVTFTATPALRWLRRTTFAGDYLDSDKTDCVLQQAHQGSDGTVQWRDVPVVQEGE